MTIFVLSQCTATTPSEVQGWTVITAPAQAGI